MTLNSPMKIIGRKPVLDALNAEADIDRVYVQYNQKGSIINAIFVAAKKRGIKISQVPPDKFKEITSHPNSQGVAAIKSEQKFYSLDEIISASKNKKYPLLLLLDSIQDPQNLGAILRSAECSGVDGVIITKHNSAPVNQTVVKTSAGATEHLKIHIANNLVQVIQQLKDEEFWIVGSTLEDAKDYTSIDYKMPTALIMGSEEKGIRRLTAENCDFLVKIPMDGNIQSLNVSVATGILLFEILRQRKN